MNTTGTTSAVPAQGFELEPSPVADGTVPDRVISELRAARRKAKDLSTAYSDAITAQAEKFGIKPSALKRYIAALEDDKLADVDAELHDLQALIG